MRLYYHKPVSIPCHEMTNQWYKQTFIFTFFLVFLALVKTIQDNILCFIYDYVNSGKRLNVTVLKRVLWEVSLKHRHIRPKGICGDRFNTYSFLLYFKQFD
jgi:hypothetical protein